MSGDGYRLGASNLSAAEQAELNRIVRKANGRDPGPLPPQ